MKKAANKRGGDWVRRTNLKFDPFKWNGAFYPKRRRFIYIYIYKKKKGKDQNGVVLNDTVRLLPFPPHKQKQRQPFFYFFCFFSKPPASLSSPPPPPPKARVADQPLRDWRRTNERHAVSFLLINRERPRGERENQGEREGKKRDKPKTKQRKQKTKRKEGEERNTENKNKRGRGRKIFFSPPLGNSHSAAVLEATTPRRHHSSTSNRLHARCTFLSPPCIVFLLVWAVLPPACNMQEAGGEKNNSPPRWAVGCWASPMLAQPCKSGPVLAQTVEVFGPRPTHRSPGPRPAPRSPGPRPARPFFGLSPARLFGPAHPDFFFILYILYIIICYNICVHICIYI